MRSRRASQTGGCPGAAYTAVAGRSTTNSHCLCALHATRMTCSLCTLVLEPGLGTFPSEMLHPEQVKGKRLDLDTGIRTRSRAAAQQEQYEAVPAPVQIFALLADMLIEAREGAVHSLGC